MITMDNIKIAVIGLGYVGLPLAVEFGKHRPVVGLDINEKRVKELRDERIDHTLEVNSDELQSAEQLTFTSDVNDIADANFYIITVPTPIDDNNAPDLKPLESASTTVGQAIKKGDVVVYESTVYPGATEEVCIPIIEKTSGLIFNQDFYAGYSPERINPGDKINTLTKITKITSGSTPEAADLIDSLYASIITAGTYRATSIKVAEAAKVIENTQRDLNIAIVNEFAKIFNIIGIDTQAVLDAAGSKWNFLKFKPGLVGGHCISVDPYYLTHKAQEVGYRPEVILAGRRINDGMGQYVATQMVKKLARNKIHIDEAKILVLGFTFKGDCPDTRNTKIIDVIKELNSFNINVDVYDDWADKQEVADHYGIDLIDTLAKGRYDGIIVAVDHSNYKELGIDFIRSLAKPNHVVYDVKNVFTEEETDIRL
ncbi:Vi polysaccharide biosynthesis UDP-N-acetylglucosamine C-6 dehydrogenase TviB [Psychrobacter sp. 16-MNA-CIBAN-0192]|uniref:Vi polysaccharide biosynthesis UDP-N-acetylglucosamine C-6 dehydrogenase TviB n=1 Tax=Psychrobacter sp. 16-MNA-CIBAN-0192 TaxID=3140448 RepID=UPI0033341CC1